MYCLKCRHVTETDNVTTDTSKNGTPMKRGQCIICGKTKTQFQRRRVNVNSIDEIWAADLIDMQAFSKENNGIKYVLTVIDVLSKKNWNLPLKRKTGQEVANAFSRILDVRRPSKMWVDKGQKFYNKDVQKLVELYSTENEEKSCVIERFNRTIKEKLFKYFSAYNTRNM